MVDPKEQMGLVLDEQAALEAAEHAVAKVHFLKAGFFTEHHPRISPHLVPIEEVRVSWHATWNAEVGYDRRVQDYDSHGRPSGTKLHTDWQRAGGSAADKSSKLFSTSTFIPAGQVGDFITTFNLQRANEVEHLWASSHVVPEEPMSDTALAQSLEGYIHGLVRSHCIDRAGGDHVRNLEYQIVGLDVSRGNRTDYPVYKVTHEGTSKAYDCFVDALNANNVAVDATLPRETKSILYVTAAWLGASGLGFLAYKAAEAALKGNSPSDLAAVSTTLVIVLTLAYAAAFHIRTLLGSRQDHHRDLAKVRSER